ncbi:MAG TPA: carbohydrate ABC transporter permease [Ruminiclostridium sp.]
MKKEKLYLYLRVTIGWLLSLIILIPFSIILLNTLKTSQEAAKFDLVLPSIFHWGNYVTVFNESHLGRAFFNSIILSTFPTILSIMFTASAAFVISRNRSKFGVFLHRYFFVGLMAPLNIVPIILILKYLNLTNTFVGTVLVTAALGIPFAFFLFYGFFGTISREIDEAAIIDGCGGYRLFYSIIFPLLKPVTVTGALLNFLGAWNDFKIPLYILNSSKKMGMIINMYSYFGQKQSDWNLVCTVIILTLLPVVALYLVAQKQIVSGMTSGAVKG